MHSDRLVDEIYEAAIVPERWKIVLDGLARLADAEGALLFAAAPGLARWLSTDNIRSHIEAWIASPFYLKNPRGERLVPIKEPRFLTDLDAFTPEELDREPFYTDFLRPRGLGWCIGTSIYSPAGDILVVSIEKAQKKAPYRERSPTSSIIFDPISRALPCCRDALALSERGPRLRV
ncbi:hypothetical protein [Bradyrhizobium sp. RDT46]|uniref:hypothetical protein n=1 Tax=Bradyrhizobium sp. RDT46 TaxID=3341829 RepID=UPI0035C66CC3